MTWSLISCWTSSSSTQPEQGKQETSVINSMMSKKNWKIVIFLHTTPKIACIQLLSACLPPALQIYWPLGEASICFMPFWSILCGMLFFLQQAVQPILPSSPNLILFCINMGWAWRIGRFACCKKTYAPKRIF